jgi:hypothetical protein
MSSIAAIEGPVRERDAEAAREMYAHLLEHGSPRQQADPIGTLARIGGEQATDQIARHILFGDVETACFVAWRAVAECRLAAWLRVAS